MLFLIETTQSLTYDGARELGYTEWYYPIRLDLKMLHQLLI